MRFRSSSNQPAAVFLNADELKWGDAPPALPAADVEAMRARAAGDDRVGGPGSRGPGAGRRRRDYHVHLEDRLLAGDERGVFEVVVDLDHASGDGAIALRHEAGRKRDHQDRHRAVDRQREADRRLHGFQLLFRRALAGVAVR